MPVVKFEAVPIGREFFDPVSGEYWRKENARTATCLTGGDAIEGEDEFDASDPVEFAE